MRDATACVALRCLVRVKMNAAFVPRTEFAPMQTTSRHLGPLDRLLDGVESFLGTVAGDAIAARPSPAEGVEAAELDEHERRRVAGLMRVNHTGEVCAQALYQGQALLARSDDTARHLAQAASEETDHLAWCGQRLRELNARPSLLNPVWYAGSYAIGALAAMANDHVSLGFVMETERQVEAHLADHIARLPAKDARSHAILDQMRTDEARHAQNARERGGVSLPFPVPTVMKAASRVMKGIAYRI